MDTSLWALFSSAFLSSTLLPGGSEAVLAWLQQVGDHSPWLLLGVATLGNTLGGMTSWGLGRLIAIRYPAAGLVRTSHRRALARIERWGSPVLLLSWLPVIGDPLCVAAGWLRIHWLTSLLFIGLGKGLRYAVLLWMAG
ncbi:MAG TPA: DedA family protein [Chromatiales bacterium]|nr:DedA family protein [Chromatiales bacterium]